MEKLKACPFCGSTNIVFEGVYGERPVCSVCGAEIDGWSTHEKAIAAWNRRAEPENKPLTLEQLKQMEGEQVWIPETEAYFSGHGIVNVKEEKVYASDEENDYYPFDEYGAWVAYARKPEGSKNNGA